MKKPTKAQIEKLKKELDTNTDSSTINIAYKIWSCPYQIQHFENSICVWDKDGEIHILQRSDLSGIQINFVRKTPENIKSKKTCLYRDQNGIHTTIIAIRNCNVDKLQFALEEYKRWKAVKDDKIDVVKAKLYKASYKIPTVKKKVPAKKSISKKK